MIDLKRLVKNDCNMKSTARPAKRAMTIAELVAFLHSKPGWIILSTIGKNGYPHSVPLGYFVDEVAQPWQVVMGVRAGTQKLKNIQRNAKVSLLLETSDKKKKLSGALIQGEAKIYDDSESVLDFMRKAAVLRGETELPVKAREGAVYITVTADNIISWMPVETELRN